MDLPKDPKKLISEGKLEAAIKILKEDKEYEGMINHLVSLSARLNDLKKNERNGTISYSDLVLQKNKISQSLLEIIDGTYTPSKEDDPDLYFKELGNKLKKHHVEISHYSEDLKRGFLEFASKFESKDYTLVHHLLFCKDLIYQGVLIASTHSKGDHGTKLIFDTFKIFRDLGIINLEKEIKTYQRPINFSGSDKIFPINDGLISNRKVLTEEYKAYSGYLIPSFTETGKKFIAYLMLKNEKI